MTDSTIKIAILGAGRMGQQVARIVEALEDCEVAGVWSRNNDSKIDELLQSADIAIDFTLPEANAEIIRAMVRTKKPLVCGVTGLDATGMASLTDAAKTIALLYDRNMSLGIAVMTNLVKQASLALGPKYRAEIWETHHVHKKDAPSGTAIALREAIGNESVNIDSQRVGEVVGDHKVGFSTANESFEMSHHVADRRVFAEGAVNAARWLLDKPPGLYRMADLASHKRTET